MSLLRRSVRYFRLALGAAGAVFCAHAKARGESPGDDLASAMSAPLALARAEAWSGASGALTLGVRAGMSASPGERQRTFGVIELGVPIDRWFGAVPALAAAPSESELVAPDRLGAPAERASGAAAPALTQSGPSTALRLTSELARKAVEVALGQLGSESALGALDSMASRSRSAASLPELRLGAGSSRDESLRLAPTLDDPARFTRDGGRDLWFEARLTWHLERAIFSDDEIAIERLKAQHREDRARLTREVLDALLDWQRAELTLGSELSGAEEQVAAELAQLGALTRLDVATGGWFSGELSRRRRRPPVEGGPSSRQPNREGGPRPP